MVVKGIFVFNQEWGKIMAILTECPICHKKQSAKNKRCSCGESLDKAKKSGRVKYWISYRLPDGKQRRESVEAMEDLNGYSIEDARTAMAKRKVQKKEKRVLDMVPESKMTFQDLTDWYLKLSLVKKLSSYDRIEGALGNFNMVYGNWQLDIVKQTDLENYQERRKG